MDDTAAILHELRLLIINSCEQNNPMPQFRKFHKELIQWTYGSTDVEVDSHRRRVSMLVITEENRSDLLIGGGIMYTNLYFKDFQKFLERCLRESRRNISFYRQLLRSYYLVPSFVD